MFLCSGGTLHKKKHYKYKVLRSRLSVRYACIGKRCPCSSCSKWSEMNSLIYMAMRKPKETRDSKTKVEKSSLLLLAPNSNYIGRRLSRRAGAVCKTVVIGWVGSTPTLPTNICRVSGWWGSGLENRWLKRLVGSNPMLCAKKNIFDFSKNLWYNIYRKIKDTYSNLYLIVYHRFKSDFASQKNLRIA